MSCREVREQLLTGAIDASLTEHLGSCDSCRQVADAVRGADAQLQHWLDDALRGDPDAALAAARSHPGRRPALRWFMTLSLVLAAAGALVWASGTPAPPPADPPEDAAYAPPDSASVIEAVASIPWNALSEEDWVRAADQLYEALLVEDDRQLRFGLLVQLGRAAENANDPHLPYVGLVEGSAVNTAWYQAGAMALDDPSLMDGIRDDELRSSVRYYREQIVLGSLPADVTTFDELPPVARDDRPMTVEVGSYLQVGLPGEVDEVSIADERLIRVETAADGRAVTLHGLAVGATEVVVQIGGITQVYTLQIVSPDR